MAAWGVLRAEDVLILVSKGGSTRELVTLIPGCKAIGATLLAVTENAQSAIATAADAVLLLHTASEPDPFNMPGDGVHPFGYCCV